MGLLSRFLHALRDGKHISPKKLAKLLSWKHSGFHIHAAEDQRVRPGDHQGRKRLDEYLLRHPFPGGRSLGEDPSLQKITWNATTKTVIYRSKRHHSSLPCVPFVAHRAKSGRKLRMPALRSRRGEEGAGQRKVNGSEEGLSWPENYRRSHRMFYAYILRSELNPERFYFGFTTDLKKRLKAHNQGENISTKTGIPWTLAWYGGFESESAALDFERYLKTASGKAFARKRLLRT